MTRSEPLAKAIKVSAYRGYWAAPPVISKCCPLTQAASGLAKYSAASARSSGVPNLLSIGRVGDLLPQRVVVDGVGEHSGAVARRRLDRIDGHPACAYLHRENIDEVLRGHLAAPVQPRAREGGISGGRSDIDDATSVGDVLCGPLDGEEGALGVDREQPVVVLLGDLGDGLIDDLHAGVGDHDVQPSESIDCSLVQRIRVGDHRDVAAHGDRLGAGGLDSGDGFLGGGVIFGVVADDVGS
jgi:hypothetical protein